MRVRFLSPVGLAVSVLVLACQSTDLAAPVNRMAPRSNSARHDESGGAHGQQARIVACKPDRGASGSGQFGPSGGTLVFGGSRLIIPGGALRTTVTITATPLNDGTSTVDFQPQGLQFHKAVGLVLNAAGCALPDEGTPSVVYIGPDGQILETLPARYEPRWKTVAASIEHFSGYAIAF
jgi:hypothetical protein